MYPNTFILVALPHAKSMSLSALSAHFFMAFLSSTLGHNYLWIAQILSFCTFLSNVLDLVHPWFWINLKLGCRCLVCCAWLSTAMSPLRFCRSHVPHVKNSSSLFFQIPCSQGILNSSRLSCYLLLRLLIYMYLSQLMRTFTNYLKCIVISS